MSDSERKSRIAESSSTTSSCVRERSALSIRKGYVIARSAGAGDGIATASDGRHERGCDAEATCDIQVAQGFLDAAQRDPMLRGRVGQLADTAERELRAVGGAEHAEEQRGDDGGGQVAAGGGTGAITDRLHQRVGAHDQYQPNRRACFA